MRERNCPGCGIRRRVDDEGRIAPHDSVREGRLRPCSGSGQKLVSTIKVRVKGLL